MILYLQPGRLRNGLSPRYQWRRRTGHRLHTSRSLEPSLRAEPVIGASRWAPGVSPMPASTTGGADAADLANPANQAAGRRFLTVHRGPQDRSVQVFGL